MKLYHGTGARHLKRVLRHGLQPRGKRVGNWQHSVASHPNAVYLTNAYALYYAFCGTRGNESDGVVFEIDSNRLNPWSLCPDEDYLAQVAKHAFDKDKNLLDLTAKYRERLTDFAGTVNFENSINHLGNCCHMGAIPVSAITRYAIVPDIVSWVRWSDPTISLMNFMILGDYYRALTASLFGDDTGYRPDVFERYALPPRAVLSTVKVIKL